MNLYDVTMPIREGMFSFPKAPRYKIVKYLDVAKGDPYDEFYLMMSNLLNIPAGLYESMILPILVQGADAVPARAFFETVRNRA